MSVLTIILISLMAISIGLYCLAAASRDVCIYLMLTYLILMLVFTLIGAYLIHGLHVSNDLFLFHVYTPLEYLLLCLFYGQILSSRAMKKVIWISIPVFIGLSVFFSLYFQKTADNNSLMTMLESFLLVLWSLVYLLEALLLQQVRHLQVYPLFWISVGILFYFAGSFTIEGLLTYMMRRNMTLAQRVYRYEYIFKFLYLVLLMIGAGCAIAGSRSAVPHKD